MTNMCCDDIGERVLKTFLPIAHPLSVAPIVRTEEGYFFAAEACFDTRHPRFKLGFLEDFVSHRGAAEDDEIGAKYRIVVDLSDLRAVHGCTFFLEAFFDQDTHLFGVARAGPINNRCCQGDSSFQEPS